MSDSFNFKLGDIVRAEFAPPAKGWIEGEYMYGSYNKICLKVRTSPTSPQGKLITDYDTFSSIKKVEPPIQPGDVVIVNGDVLVANQYWSDEFEGDGWFYRVPNDGFDVGNPQLLDDAVWIRRGGKLLIGNE